MLSREDLLERVWGYDYFGDSRLVDVHIRRLRTKIEPDPANPAFLVTVRGAGYKLVLSCRVAVCGCACSSPSAWARWC